MLLAFEELEKKRVDLNNFRKQCMVKDPKNSHKHHALVSLFLTGLKVSPPKYGLIIK